MKTNVSTKFLILPATGVALALTLIVARPATVQPSRQAATTAATLSAVGAISSECDFINVLIAKAPATPVVTKAATMAAAQFVATAAVATTVIVPTISPTAKPIEGGAAEAGGGDEAPTTYKDAVLKFAINYPHSWSQDTTFSNGTCFTGRDASIAVQFAPVAIPTDLLAYVKADEAVVKAESPGYKNVYLKASPDLQGLVILGYEWDAGNSSVTGKPLHVRTDRYYGIDSAKRLVVITETWPPNQFDPAGVHDTVLTYQVLK